MSDINELLERMSKSQYMASNKQTKTITFNNTSGTVNLFTVTGEVFVSIFGVVDTSLASAGGCNGEVGCSGDTNGLIISTDMTTLTAGLIWINSGPVSVVGITGIFIIGNGDDIILTLQPAKQVDSGAITFYCYWTPISGDGKVVAA